jgi:exopolysaccharide production protein ExoQ
LTTAARGHRSSLDQPVPGVAEQVFGILALLLLAGGAFPLLRTDAAGDASAISLITTAVVCLAAGAVLQARQGGVIRLLRQLDPVVLSLLVLIGASLIWSVDPALTGRRALAVLLYTVFGLYIVDRYPLGEQPWLIARVVGVAAIASVLVALLAPKYGVLPGKGTDWRGIFAQKNVLGRMMALGIFSSALAAALAESRRRRSASLVIMAICALVLIKASSVFAEVSLLVICLPVIVLWLLRQRFPARQALVVVAVVTAIVGVVMAIEFRDWLLASAGRDSGLTGRVQLWSSCWHALQSRPWFGYGYGAFWHGWNAPSTQVLLENPWGPPHAHNGPLDLALGIGVIGSALWLAALVGSLVRGVSILARNRTLGSIWAISFPLFVLAYNVTEVTTTGNAFFWLIFVAISTSLYVAARAPRQLSVTVPHREWRRGTGAYTPDHA